MLFALLSIVTVAAIACDEAKPKTSARVSPTSPSFVVTGSRVTPSISAVANGCFVFPRPLADLQLIVTASSTDVFVDEVVVRVGDGTNLGGPMITVPRPTLNAQFGNTMVRAGATRAFGFPSAFSCGTERALPARAIVSLIDASGARSSAAAPVVRR